MNREKLLADYGSPIRIEKKVNGDEDWYYLFLDVVNTSEVIKTTDEFSSKSTVEWSTVEQPIHVSSDSRVFGNIPRGQIVIE